MSDIIIRSALLNEVDAIYELLSQTDSLHREAHPKIFKQAEFPENIKDYYRSCIQNTQSTILIAEDFGEIIGAIICSFTTTSENPVLVPRNYACIENITVSKQFRRGGIGSKLMNAAHEWAVQMGASMMELSVWEFNQGSISFYHQLGYQTIRRRMSKEL